MKENFEGFESEDGRDTANACALEVSRNLAERGVKDPLARYFETLGDSRSSSDERLKALDLALKDLGLKGFTLNFLQESEGDGSKNI